jgi:hypothetical protein
MPCESIALIATLRSYDRLTCGFLAKQVDDPSEIRLQSPNSWLPVNF